jgi:hypothetical protein
MTNEQINLIKNREDIFFLAQYIINKIEEMKDNKLCRNGEKQAIGKVSTQLHKITSKIEVRMPKDVQEATQARVDFYYDLASSVDVRDEKKVLKAFKAAFA